MAPAVLREATSERDKTMSHSPPTKKDDALRLLRADPGNQHQAHRERAHDAAERIGGVDSSGNTARVFVR